MSHTHVCVWIDHYEAKVYGIAADSSDASAISDRQPHHHIHRSADHLGIGTEPIHPEFLGEVAAALQSAKAILICGPGNARRALSRYLEERHPEIAKRVWEVMPMDHPTEGQIVATARKFFRAADRMHA